jgi:hypothetical protein
MILDLNYDYDITHCLKLLDSVIHHMCTSVHTHVDVQHHLFLFYSDIYIMLTSIMIRHVTASYEVHSNNFFTILLLIIVNTKKHVHHGLYTLLQE